MALSILLLGFTSCENDDDVAMIVPEAGTLVGGPFNFVVDGTADNVSGISIQGTTTGTNSSYVITDEAGSILGLPATLSDLEGVDFDAAGPGVCLIWYIRYEEGLTGLSMGENANSLNGDFDLSNSLTVTRSALFGASLSGGPFTFIVDSTADQVSGISVDDSLVNGMNTTFVITDEENNILGLPTTLTDVEGVDFNGAGAGVCLIWHLTYGDGLTGLTVGNNVSDFVGTYVLSNSVSVTRASAGTLAGGPFLFTIDDMPDMVNGISVSENQDLMETGYVITDDANNILGLPPSLMDVEGVDFNGAGAGVCLIWRITYEAGLTGLEVGENVSGLNGTYSLSNSIEVTRASAGTLSGGPFDFTVDGTPDMVSGITVDENLDLMNTGWVITDDANNILGLPPTLTDVEGVDFDAAGAGVCLIWRITYEDGLSGLMTGANVSGLTGTYDLSNAITVSRN